MGRDLARDFVAAAAIRDQIAAAFRSIDPMLDLNRLLESDSAADLLPTDVCQSVVFAHSAMAWKAFDTDIRRAIGDYVPVAALGHSCGELTAHLASGTLDTATMS